SRSGGQAMAEQQVIPTVSFDSDDDLVDLLPPLEWDYEKALSNRHTDLTPAIGTFQATAKPILLRRGEGAYLYDADGNRFIDTVAQNQAISVGYRHPFVYAEVKQQLSEIQHRSTMWIHPGPDAVAQRGK